jgi:hypothetical protein
VLYYQVFYFNFKGHLGQIRDEKYHRIMQEKYGKIMKISRIPGMINMVMLFDPDDTEKVSVYRSP